MLSNLLVLHSTYPEASSLIIHSFCCFSNWLFPLSIKPLVHISNLRILPSTYILPSHKQKNLYKVQLLPQLYFACIDTSKHCSLAFHPPLHGTSPAHLNNGLVDSISLGFRNTWHTDDSLGLHACPLCQYSSYVLHWPFLPPPSQALLSYLYLEQGVPDAVP